MTWKKIIDNNDWELFNLKADTQEFIFVMYSALPPYLPIDFGYSLYELSIKYGIAYDTIYRNFLRGTVNDIGFTIKKVLTGC